MKNTKTKIVLSAIIFLLVVGFVGTVNAAGASLYVSPAILTKTTGNTFNVSVGLNASDNKVCAVEGTLLFNNLSCQIITVVDDVMAQSSPTCLNPYFLIGIPNCTTSDKTLLTLSIKAGSAGTASINLTGVDIIGEGVSVGSASISGNYTINAVPTSTPTPTPTTPITPTTPAEEPIEEAAGEEAAGEELAVEEELFEGPELVEVGLEEPTGFGKFLAAIGAFPLNLKVILVIVALILIVLIILWLFKKKRKRE